MDQLGALEFVAGGLEERESVAQGGAIMSRAVGDRR